MEDIQGEQQIQEGKDGLEGEHTYLETHLEQDKQAVVDKQSLDLDMKILLMDSLLEDGQELRVWDMFPVLKGQHGQ